MAFRALLRRFRQSELGGLASDTSYVAVWQAAGVAADFVQIALVTHALGLAEYGQLALAIAFVTLVGGFFNVRIGIAAVTHGGPRVAEGNYQAAASVFRLAYLIDFGTVAWALAALAVLAPLVGPSVIGEGGVALVLVYALTLVGQALETTSLSVLRLFDRFRRASSIGVASEVARVALVAVAVGVGDDLIFVAAAVAIAKLGGGIANITAAARTFRATAQGWDLTDRVGSMARDERKAMLGTIFHTNIVAYARVAQVQVPTLLVGAIAGTTQTALYKVGMAVAGGVTKIVDPATTALLPRFTRLWSAGRTADLRRLIRQATMISVPVAFAAFVLLVVLREPVLHALGGGPEAAGAETVLILAAAANVLNAAVFWRGALLYAVGRVRVLTAISVPMTAAQVAAVALLTPEFGANGAAFAFAGTMAFSAVALSIAAVRALEERPPAAFEVDSRENGGSGHVELVDRARENPLQPVPER
jgi:O-antigen/teichoic acid export membrane protein